MWLGFAPAAGAPVAARPSAEESATRQTCALMSFANAVRMCSRYDAESGAPLAALAPGSAAERSTPRAASARSSSALSMSPPTEVRRAARSSAWPSTTGTTVDIDARVLAISALARPSVNAASTARRAK